MNLVLMIICLCALAFFMGFCVAVVAANWWDKSELEKENKILSEKLERLSMTEFVQYTEADVKATVELFANRSSPSRFK